MKPIRNSAKAIIIKDGKILLTKNQDHYGVFYLLPGGGQEAGETMHEAVKRECMEEISCEVDVGDLLFVRDYISNHHEFADLHPNAHQIEYMFACTILSGEPANGCIPDDAQLCPEWIELKDLKNTPIYPSILKDVIHADGSLDSQVYLGDVN